jgi:biopolymer transport protein ExbD
MKFQKKTQTESKIPTASLPDIVFLLMIFFMVSSVFKQYRGIPVLVPVAKATEKIETKRHLTYIWADQFGRISIDDKLVEVKDIEGIIGQKLAENRRLIVSLKIDKNVPMGLVTDIQEQLRDAYALRINYATRFL